MHLNHINLCSSDVEGLTAKLTSHFGYRTIEAGTIPNSTDGAGDSHFASVVGADGSELVITQIEPTREGQSAYPKGFHFGLIQPSRQAVYAKHDELVEAGFQPRDINDGFEVWGATWTAFYCPLGDGLEIEINYRTRSEILDRD